TAIVIPGPRAGPAPPARAVGGARTRGGQWWGDRHLPVRRGLRVLLLVCAVHPAVDPHLRRRRRLAAARRPVRAGADRGGVRRGGAVGGAGPAAAGRTRRHRRTAALQPRGVADRRVATGPAPGPRRRLAGLPLGRPPPGPDAGGYAHLRPAAGVPPVALSPPPARPHSPPPARPSPPAPAGRPVRHRRPGATTAAAGPAPAAGSSPSPPGGEGTRW